MSEDEFEILLLVVGIVLGIGVTLHLIGWFSDRVRSRSSRINRTKRKLADAKPFRCIVCDTMIEPEDKSCPGCGFELDR